MPSNSRWLVSGGALLLAGCLSGCSAADYLNRRDTVTLRAGESVRANLEQQTINPSKASMYNQRGLGADGNQIPSDEEEGGASLSEGS